MNNKFMIEVDEDFVEAFYGLVEEIPVNSENLSVDDLKKVVDKIKKLLPATNTKNEAFGSFSNDEKTKTVLIVDDLGTITYQISTLLTKKGFNTICSREIYDAITKYKKQHFDIVILDLFIPTEREGFILLDEILKINEQKTEKSIVGIMTASSKKEHKQFCRERGADFYVEKIDDWQKNIIEMCCDLCNKVN